MCLIFFESVSSSNMAGCVGTSFATPTTSAPILSNHVVNHEPLKPVCPVTSTRFPRYEFSSIIIDPLTTVHDHSPTPPPMHYDHVQYPYIASILYVRTPSIGHRVRDPAMVIVLKHCHRPSG